MTTSSDILLSLTRAALWDKVPQLDTALTASTWKDIYFQAVKQAVQGIVHDAICRLPEALLPPDEVLLPWKEEVRLIEATRQQQLMALAWVTSCMEAESSLRPVILKGLPLADLYPIPAHRVSGDIDVFYGSAAACLEADHLVASWGLPVQRDPLDDSIYMVGSVPVEHHSLLYRSHVPFRRRRLISWVERRMKEADATREVVIDGLPLHMLSPELDLVQLSGHALKHALNEGIGLRQLCDIALFVSHNREALSPALVCPILKRHDLLRWTDLCLSYGLTYLGLQQEQLPYPVHANPQLVAAMHEEVLQSGNFGLLDERFHTKGKAPQKKATAHRIMRNVWRYLRVCPQEAVCWSLGLTALRLKEKTGWKR